MSLSATLALAAAAASAPAPQAQPPRAAVLAEARVTVQILPAAAVRQASGPEPAGDSAPRHQLSRRGNTVLVEFQ
ncbi:MAG TPA: hypothetical protein VFS49_11035 [Croceibacterium sp.]|nr:hypothetical protein [Croceibacterium sp.]